MVYDQPVLEDDNATLKQLHESLQELYRRLQEERDALKRRLRHDQAEMDELVRRTQSELARLREQLRAKCRECEELQHHALSPQEITRWRRRLEEELREAELEPIRRQLEGQIAEAQGQARNMERVLEQERGRARVVEVELKDKLDVETTASRSKDQILERSKATMEAERRKAEDLQVEVSRLEQQLEDQETRMRGLREQLQARELQSQQEQLVWKQELDRKVSDEQATRRENQQLQELRHEESLRAEKQLQENEARLVQEYSQKLSSYESQCKNLKDEVLNMSSRQDQERRDWRKQLDEERGRACELKDDSCWAYNFDDIRSMTQANRSKDQILETSKATLEDTKDEQLRSLIDRVERVGTQWRRIWKGDSSPYNSESGKLPVTPSRGLHRLEKLEDQLSRVSQRVQGRGGGLGQGCPGQALESQSLTPHMSALVERLKEITPKGSTTKQISFMTVVMRHFVRAALQVAALKQRSVQAPVPHVLQVVPSHSGVHLPGSVTPPSDGERALDASLSHRFVMRAEGDKSIFFISEAVAELLRQEVKLPTRMVMCGVAAFQRTGAHHERACPWQLAQEGAAQLSQALKRQLTCSRSFLRKLLAEKELTIPEVRSAAAEGEVNGLEALLDGDALRPGSIALTLRSGPDEEKVPYAVVANVSEGALELQLRPQEAASLLEDLAGQPTVQEMLAAKETDSKDDVEGEADVEDND
ncbi:unnamed protein product [Cladocopium goreaui]|uniref:RRM domain-containing protein n=1 Tax=Cladocopium goreaui TaxID=2562237 RepID=A0A9P1GMM5_9DINO|nr:unnamed protein product [Cladocopium goreaui]